MKRSLLLLFTALLLSSCASLPLGGGNEPRIVVVRNLSGADIATVTLRESASGQHASGFGSISPVPAGIAQVYVRGTDPPAFPRTIMVEWVDNEGRTHVKELSLSKALKDATGESGEALMIEIGPYEEVLVFIEKHPK